MQCGLLYFRLSIRCRRHRIRIEYIGWNVLQFVDAKRSAKCYRYRVDIIRILSTKCMTTLWHVGCIVGYVGSLGRQCYVALPLGLHITYCFCLSVSPVPARKTRTIQPDLKLT